MFNASKLCPAQACGKEAYCIMKVRRKQNKGGGLVHIAVCFRSCFRFHCNARSVHCDIRRPKLEHLEKAKMPDGGVCGGCARCLPILLQKSFDNCEMGEGAVAGIWEGCHWLRNLMPQIDCISKLFD